MLPKSPTSPSEQQQAGTLDGGGGLSDAVFFRSLLWQAGGADRPAGAHVWQRSEGRKHRQKKQLAKSGPNLAAARVCALLVHTTGVSPARAPGALLVARMVVEIRRRSQGQPANGTPRQAARGIRVLDAAAAAFVEHVQVELALGDVAPVAVDALQPTPARSAAMAPGE